MLVTWHVPTHALSSHLLFMTMCAAGQRSWDPRYHGSVMALPAVLAAWAVGGGATLLAGAGRGGSEGDRG